MERFAIPSREDAWNLTRSERMSLLFLMNTVSAMLDAKKDLAERLDRIDGGHELMDTMCDSALKVLEEVRKTIPENQRVSVNNVTKDMEMRMVPKMAPTKTNVIMPREELRELIDAAQVKCRDCVEDGEECKACGLYKVLTSVVPLEKHGETMLCPYNMAVWEN